MTPEYPINLRLAGKPVLLIGGGEIAEGRACALVLCRAEVTLISPRLTPGLQGFADRGEVRHLRRRVVESDIPGHVLVLAATGDAQANADIARWARARGILVNVADDPPNLDFSLPSTLRRGDLLVTVSTSGASPGYAADLRRRLEAHVDEAEGQALEIVRQHRERLRTVIPEQRARFEAVKHLVALGLAETIRREGLEAARARAREAVEALLAATP